MSVPTKLRSYVVHRAAGRATVELLRLNREIALAIRAEEARLGRHPEE